MMDVDNTLRAEFSEIRGAVLGHVDDAGGERPGLKLQAYVARFEHAPAAVALPKLTPGGGNHF